MRITISGTAGSGKSSVGKLLAKKLKLKHYSTGDFMREMAEHRGLSIMDFSKLAEEDREIDLELDQRQTELGKKEDNFVIDGRLSFNFISNSIKIYLDADLKQRAERIFRDISRTEDHSDVKDTMKSIKKREASEKKRYKEYYDLEIMKEDFDLVVDTTDSTVEKSVDKIIEFLK